LDIEARTRRSLEWERLKGFLAAEACSEFSRELCLQAEVHVDREVVEVLLQESAEALALLSAGFGLSQDGLPELRAVHQRLAAGAQLGAGELLALRRMLMLARRTRNQLSQLTMTQLAAADFPRLTKFPEQMHLQTDLVQAIDAVFDDAGNIRDDASPQLKALRRQVQRLTARTRDELQRIINNANAAKALQEPLYTQRNGRYVLPVQASMRSSIPGIVHDSSASGLTVYVEPFTVVELTNEVRLKESQIEHEIERILAELSNLARTKHEQLEVTYRTLVEIDFIAARARLARIYNGVKPHLSTDDHMDLQQARHPLLVLQNLDKQSNVVANHILLGAKVRTMVITGPNTGGKTVYLKTAGLLALMTGAGLLLPVAPGSTAVLFKNVFADIGDEQSIEQNLSTFSSHMTNIIEIVNRSRSGTLVLLDEIGAGTDPREGAILARVILEHLNASGALTISSTHYGEMKTLAYTTDGFLNGSFEFDDEHLLPTYHLRIGVPGASKAITIASRLGLLPQLVAAARLLVEGGQTDFQEMIEQLERRLHNAVQAEDDWNQRRQQLTQLEAETAELRAQLQEEREKMRSAAANRMQGELDEAQKLVRTLIADLQKQPSIAKAQRLQKDLETLRTDLGWLEPEPPPPPTGPVQFQLGQKVKVRSLNQKGVIEALPDAGKSGVDAQASVRAGAIKIKVPLSDLQPLAGGGTPGSGPGSGPGGGPGSGPGSGPGQSQGKLRGHHKVRGSAGGVLVSGTVGGSGADLDVFVRTTNNTIDMRGQRVDEALGNLERFVDSAFLARLSPIMIIHGHGTGQLKAAVRNFLKESPYQSAWRPGENYEGGDGVTVVQFK
jgi:DNA mismatch repair protein MutS2